MVKDVRFDVLAILGAFQEKHLQSSGIHLDDIGIRLLVEIPPATDIIVVKTVEFLAFLAVFRMIACLIVIQTMIAFTDFDVGFQA